jgi:hypothetical protein
MPRVALLLVLFALPCHSIPEQYLFTAFAEVYQLRDSIQDGSTPVLRQALLELEKEPFGGRVPSKHNFFLTKHNFFNPSLTIHVQDMFIHSIMSSPS